MSITIRPLAETDRSRWEVLFQDYAIFYKTTITADGMNSVWQWIFDPDNAFWCDVAEDKNGDVVGFTHYHLLPRPVSGGMICFLSDLFVDPACRGCGVGRALIDQIVQFVNESKLPNLRWLTQEFNYSARNLYDSYVPKSDFILYNIDTL